MKSSVTSNKVKSGIGSGLLLLSIIILIISCAGKKSIATIQNFEQLSEAVNAREFKIENEWAIPLGGSMVNLIGNPNYIRFKKDSVEIFLPYFGVRHSGGGYGSEGGIKYEGPARNLKIMEEKDRNRIILKFDGRQESESLQFNITLFAGGNSNTSVTSSQRNSISYRGDVMALPEDEQK